MYTTRRTHNHTHKMHATLRSVHIHGEASQNGVQKKNRKKNASLRNAGLIHRQIHHSWKCTETEVSRPRNYYLP